MDRNFTLAIVGLGRIGLPLLASFAKSKYCVLGIGFDIDDNRIKRLQETYEPDFYEPGLRELLGQQRDKIRFTTDYSLISECDAVLITVGTPLKTDKTTNYDYLATAMKIGAHIKKGCTIILKSTVTPGTTQNYVTPKIEELSGLQAGKDFYIAFCPERVVEGLALQELATLPKIIGGINTESTERAAYIMEQLGGKILKVSSPTVAELCKLVDNTYRAMNIAYANEIGMMCEKMDIDSYEVVSAVNNSYARTRLFKPGLGANGPCLQKDCQIFQACARGCDIGSPIMDACIASSEYAADRIQDLVSRFIITRRVEKPVIALAGLAFKGNPETDDIRDAASVRIYRALSREKSLTGLTFKFYDPIIRNFCDNKVWGTVTECVQCANAVIFLTDHPKLLNIAVGEILKSAARPLLIIDCWHNLKNLREASAEKDVEAFQIGSKWMPGA